MVEYCKFCGKDIRDLKPTQKGQHVANCSMNPNIKKIKEKRCESKIKTVRLSNPLLKIKLKCLNCNEEFEIEVVESYYKLGTYKKCCCEKCSKQYSSNFVDRSKIKVKKCKKCGDDIQVNILCSDNVCCDECKNKKIINENRRKKNKKIVNGVIVCKICGNEKCKNPEICSKFKQKNNVYDKYFGFDGSKKGSNEIYEEFDRIVSNLKIDYFDNEMSLTEISKKFKMNYQTLQGVFKSLNIESRTCYDGNILSFKKGKYNNYRYKSGMHTTWKGDIVHYRSNYEKEYYIILDDKKIDYNVEALRIKYYDTQKKKIRVAIPDIYIKETNEIVEIKSKWTLNEINMTDKVKSYKKLGYNVRLVVGEGNKNFFKNTIDIIY